MSRDLFHLRLWWVGIQVHLFDVQDVFGLLGVFAVV